MALPLEPILAAVVVGLVGLLAVLWLALRRSGSKGPEEVRNEGSEEDMEKEESSEGPKRRKPLKSKGPTTRSRKNTLPSHSLLAADFKGHTGAVLSLDFDSSGRYLASCSEGDVHTVCRVHWV